MSNSNKKKLSSEILRNLQRLRRKQRGRKQSAEKRIISEETIDMIREQEWEEMEALRAEYLDIVEQKGMNEPK